MFYYYSHLTTLIVPTVLISSMHVAIIFTVCAVLSRVAVAWQAPTQVDPFRRKASSGPAGWMRTRSTPQTRPSQSSSARSASSIHMFMPRQQTLRLLWLPLVNLKMLLPYLPNTLFHCYYLLKKDLLYVEAYLQPDVHLHHLVWVKRSYLSLMSQVSSLLWIKIVCRLILARVGNL